MYNTIGRSRRQFADIIGDDLLKKELTGMIYLLSRKEECVIIGELQ